MHGRLHGRSQIEHRARVCKFRPPDLCKSRPPPTAEPAALNDRSVRAEKSPADLLAEAETNRAATLQLLADLPEAALDLPVKHPAYGDMIVEDVFRIIGFHERLHAEEIRRVIDRTGS